MDDCLLRKNYIPKHENCTNCGECCGPIPIGDDEHKRILEFLKTVPESEKTRIRNQKKDFLTCEFRDIENNNCFIYKVRPTMCRLFGVTEGLECPNGNLHSIDSVEHILKIKNGRLRRYL